jgi:dTDP-4-dehydrorhamnose 3,5-epimerase
MGNVKNKIHDLIVTPLKIIQHEKGNIQHVIKNSDNGYSDFGEVYISSIKYNQIKAWKNHSKMISNIVVPFGNVRFVIADLRNESISKGAIQSFDLSLSNYLRITVPADLWYGFKGLDENNNMIINFASIPHDPKEQINKEIDFIKFKW